MKKAIFLFDYTGIMAKPWADAGYLCYCFDGQHPQGVSKSNHKNILNVGAWFSNEITGDESYLDVGKIINITGIDISFVFGFPECTNLAVSGAAHFAKKRDENPFFQDEAMVLVRLTELLGENLGCTWALENPISVASTLWRKPDYKFHPYEYGGYLEEGDQHPIYPEYIKPRDAYPKKTCIWSGNGFVMPEKKPVEVEPGFSDQHKKLGGKSLKTKNIRSATPRGFARAVFETNHKLDA
mgnify:FL=1|tara:strand:+ start:282 stop:1001 length:720 start_codon:yes stop_codon:yes gene_type:complete